MRGFDQHIHPLPNKLPSALKDCRVKPENDELGQPT
jgi:hypothetical protein